MTTPLITRLEEAAEGSRELDALVWAHFRPETIKVTGWWKPCADDSGRTQVEFQLPPKRTRMVTGSKPGMPHAEPVTTSLYAALALAERVLPGWAVTMVHRLAINTLSATIFPEGNDSCGAVDDRAGRAYARTLPLALCLAILRANHKDKP